MKARLPTEDCLFGYPSFPGLARAEEQHHRRWVQKTAHDQHEPSQGRLAVGTRKRRQIAHRTKVSFGDLALALDGRCQAPELAIN
jgi:hypothetical protein